MRGLKAYTPGLKRSKLRAGDKEAGKVPPVEISGFQANQKRVQTIPLP